MSFAMRHEPTVPVVPANAGTQRLSDRPWIAAFAAMTNLLDWQAS